jgi:hypothetical protein
MNNINFDRTKNIEKSFIFISDLIATISFQLI